MSGERDRAARKRRRTSETENSDSSMQQCRKRKSVPVCDDGAIPSTSKAVPSAACVSDSSDRQSEKCPICLCNFSTQEVGNPSTCNHSFCVDCLKEWSKNANTCPLDRRMFTSIHVRPSLISKVIRTIDVEHVKHDERDIEEDVDLHEQERHLLGEIPGHVLVLLQHEGDTREDHVVAVLGFCQGCYQYDYLERMVMCARCEGPYHPACFQRMSATVEEEVMCYVCYFDGPAWE